MQERCPSSVCTLVQDIFYLKGCFNKLWTMVPDSKCLVFLCPNPLKLWGKDCSFYFISKYSPVATSPFEPPDNLHGERRISQTPMALGRWQHGNCRTVAFQVLWKPAIFSRLFISFFVPFRCWQSHWYCRRTQNGHVRTGLAQMRAY